MDDNLYSVKMRASRGKEHISGAEKIVEEKQLERICGQLLERGLHHTKGKADFINVKIEEVEPEEVMSLEALPVTTISVESSREGREKLAELLLQEEIGNGTVILDKLKETYGMRGAMLLDVDTLERMEPDLQRGIRATYMDVANKEDDRSKKNHFKEALVLATKVANHKNIIGELCISDDPDYVTGYFASKRAGYVRITKLKEAGCGDGGRIFLFRGTREEAQDCIQYLEHQKVLVNIPTEPTEEISKWKRMEQELSDLKTSHLYRSMTVLDSGQTKLVDLDGRKQHLFSSNSYLDLCNEPRVKAYASQILQEYGVGSGGSRLTTGTSRIHAELEETIAKFKNREAALVYNTGYMANVGIISALAKKGDVIYSDELNHASIIDGCRLSRAEVVVYKHNDMEDLEEKIKANKGKSGLIVSDGVFSMDGDIVNLPKFVELANRYQLLSMIDEAHATGVIGKTGRGTEEYYHMEGSVDVLMGTLSKAVGSEGGFVCGSRIFIEYLINKSRSFIFSTSLSPAVMAASKKSLELIMEEPQRVQQLQENILYFCNRLKENGIEGESETAIIPIIVGDEEKAMKVMESLKEQGYFISAIRYPTVAKGKARLRIALMATHTREEMDGLIEALKRALS